MTREFKPTHKLLSVILCITMLVTYLPLSVLASDTKDSTQYTEAVDASTMHEWKSFFPITGNVHTENAGGVWTDKSVFADAADLDFENGYDPGFVMKENNSFLVALSAIASNMTITGATSNPTDTMLVLDVSGSMDAARNQAAGALVEAANTSISTLLDANKENRVGVVLYASDATLVLPLGRYETGADGLFLNYDYTKNNRDEITDEDVSLDPDVVYEGTNSKPYSGYSAPSRDVSGATFIQNGLYLASQQFTATDNETTTTSGKARKPVIVLMSDGAPTYGTNAFVTPSARNFGSGSSSTAALSFVTQLTASNVKNQIEEKYQGEALFYTIGLGTGSDALATSVLNPSSTAQSVLDLWEEWELANAADGDTVLVYRGGRGQSSLYVTKRDGIEREYVDKYINASAEGTDLGTALKDAFQEIISDIALQSQYFPTLVSSSEDFSGYVSFIDNVGEYMHVADVKGITIGDDTLFSGADMASSFVSGGSALGQFGAPTDLGKEFITAVQTRLGLGTYDDVVALVRLAYENKQLYYNSETGEYSNYIGWYANAAGQFLGFWHEGITTMPDVNDPTLTDATRPAIIYKSYGYLGEVNGTTKTDMMYVTVRVAESIETGEQQVTFEVPAALVPTITYEVSLAEDQSVEDLTVSGAKAPIRLFYEVALDDGINEFTVREKVSSDYLNVADPSGVKTNDTAAGINFYANRYEVDGSTGFNPVTGQLTENTFSYFRPSRENDRYYYQNASLIYNDAAGVSTYKGNTAPTGTKYHGYTVYTKADDGTVASETRYHVLTAETLATAERVSTGVNSEWYIPTGDVRRDYYQFAPEKEGGNISGTLPFSAAPFTDISGHNVNDLEHTFVVGATLGNNGRLTIPSETGVKITKALAADVVDAGDSFTFEVINNSNANDNEIHPAYKIDNNGNEARMDLQFINGKVTVTLLPGEVVYVGGFAEGESVTVRELEDAKYVVQSVNNDTTAREFTADMVEGVITPANFVNAERGSGSVSVTKQINHPYGVDYQLPDMSFEITVTLEGIGAAAETYSASHIDALGATTAVQVVVENGSFKYSLKDDETLQINGLPAGTKVTVSEEAPGAGFTASYYVNGTLTATPFVTVQKDKMESVIVANTYEAKEVFPVNVELTGEKILSGRENNEWLTTESYVFALERYDFATQSWVEMATRTVNSENHTFSFSDVFADENFKYYELGTYYYRVREVQGTVPGVTYDAALHSFAVEVTDDDMNGQLEITSVRVTDNTTTTLTQDGDTYKLSATFNNVYDADVTEATVEISKKVTNDSQSPNVSLSGFEFDVYKYDIASKTIGEKLTTAPVITTVSGTTRFVISNLTDVGTFYYAIKEVVPDPVPAGWIYVTEPVIIRVDVIDNNEGQLVAKASLYNAENDVEPDAATSAVNVEFINEYKPQMAELPLDFIYKNLVGRPQSAGEFAFELKPVNYDLIKADSSVDPENYTSIPGYVISGSNEVGEGTVSVKFEQNLYFDKVGEYFHDIYEKTTDGNGVTVDKNVYHVTVTVTDVNGVLTPSYIIENEAALDIVFRNTYTPTPTVYQVSGSKTLVGRSMLNDEFTFIMKEADELGNALVNGKTYEAKNTVSPTDRNSGSFVFPEITYTEAGLYYYTVVEQGAPAGDTSGIKYDSEKTYLVKVIVTDNYETGRLVAVATATLAGEAVSEISFVNTYTPRSTDTSFSALKELQGKVLTDGAFNFELWESNANWDYVTKLETVPNAADGTINFSAVTFDKVAVKYYRIKEVNAGKSIDGVTYDDVEYRVKVTVYDDLLGQLKTIVSITDQENIPQEALVFNNYYEVTTGDTITLGGTKTLTGRAIRDGGFTFELYETDSTFAEAGIVPETTTNVGNSYSFTLAFGPELVGTSKYYVVKEKYAGEIHNGITYSTSRYEVEVKVIDNGSGGVETVVLVNGGSAIAPDSLDFVNVYRAATAVVDLAGSKTIENKDFAGEIFGFTLWNSNANGSRLSQRETAHSDSEGNFNYTALTYNTVGVRYYLITEVNAGKVIDGITYDSNRILVKVDVTDNGVGQLVADVTYTDINGNTMTDIEFVNTYAVVEDAQVILSGTKTLTGDKTFATGDFTFILSNAEDGSVVKSVANAGEKLVITLNYTPADIGKTFNYVLKEQYAGERKDGISYDAKEYEIEVRVFDGLKGKVATEVKIDGVLTTDFSSFSFTNEYTADSVAEDFAGTKVIEGKDHEGEIFSFTLYNYDAEGNKGTAIETVESDLSGNFKFTEITYTEVGTHYYLISEVDAGKTVNGILYDTTELVVRVDITDNAKIGQLEKTVTVTDINGSLKDSIKFTNKYSVSGIAEVILSGEKTLTGDKTISDGDFTFELHEIAEDAVVASGSNVGNAYSIILQYTVSDINKTFNYVLREKNAGEVINGVTYDDKSYNISVKVLDNGLGGLTTEVTVDGVATSDLTGFDFENTYKADSITVPFNGTKEISGKDYAGEIFSFVMWNSNADGEKVSEIKTVQNDAQGNFAFDEITYTEVGTHYYLITEVDAGTVVNGITYSVDELLVRVDITDEAKIGQLEKTVTVTDKKGDNKSEIIFTNTYAVTENATVVFSGTKTLSGKGFNDDDFTFELYDVASNSVIKSSGNVGNTYSIEMTYTPADIGNTYNYVVREKNAGKTINGITYDTTEYAVSVRVYDGLKGKVATEVTVTGNTPITEFDFENSYSALPAKVSFNGTKELSGRTLKADEFIFEAFKAKDDSFEYNTGAVGSATNKLNKKFVIENVEIATAGEHYFVVKENSQAALPGVKYDTNEYHITVKVTDDGIGKLHSEITNIELYNGNTAIVADSIRFENNYKATNIISLNLSGDKALIGRTAEDGEFAFILTEKADENFSAKENAKVLKAFNENDKFTFDALTFENAGRYYYVIEEDATVDVPRVTFDRALYYVVIEVTDNTDIGELEATYAISKNKDMSTSDPLVFTNVYTPKPDDILVSFAVDKKVENKGSAQITAEGFEFLLEKDGTADKLSVKTDINGKAEFTLKFSESDIGNTYTYKVSEVNDAKANVTYSTVVHTITLKIELDGSNRLYAVLTQNNAAVDKVVCEFVNEYNFTPVPATPEKPVAPQTGDNMQLLVALLCISGTGVVVTVAKAKKKDEEEEAEEA